LITITHSAGQYPIHFTSLTQALQSLPQDAVVLTDENVFTAWKGQLSQVPNVCRIEPGEGSKSFERYREVLSWMAKSGCSRRTTLVALGGGVIGDLGGFCAASYMRGIPFVQIPTTLLAQVDSSVGGKVGIDLPEGKNLVGAFYPPHAVHVPSEALSTLPDRQLRNGMAEVWKYGYILDAPLVDCLTRTDVRDDLQPIVQRCIQLKAEVVEADEFEKLGIRAKLNFGHTVGHAIEQVLRYEEFLHGEAIAIGMVVEARLGESMRITAPGTASVIEAQLKTAGLPTTWSGLQNPDPLIAAMRRDKKAHSGQLAFSLLTQIGECKLVENVAEGEVRSALLNS
jgi:3-dehydroquinate synthase